LEHLHHAAHHRWKQVSRKKCSNGFAGPLQKGLYVNGIPVSGKCSPPGNLIRLPLKPTGTRSETISNRVPVFASTRTLPSAGSIINATPIGKQ
jgi:hypothetical protein